MLFLYVKVFLTLTNVWNAGQNKSRGPTFKQDRESTLCPKLIDVNENAEQLPTCGNEKCSFIHDVDVYLASKQADIKDECYIFSTKGYCPRGATCRYIFHS